MWGYLIGLSLLFHGATYLKKQLREYDPQRLQLLSALGQIFSLAYFIAGFFIFPWYLPLLGLVVFPLIFSFAHVKFLRPNLFFALKDQAFIIVGICVCSFSIVREVVLKW